MSIRIGRKEGWDFSSNGFEIDDIGITKSQKSLFEQIFASRNFGLTGKRIVNFILVYKGTEQLTLTDFANTPVGTEIRTPNVEGIFAYIHEKKSNPDSVSDWITISTSQNGSKYKVYTALFSQTGVEAPVATVLKNTFEAEPIWTRINIGQYRATLAGTFTTNKTFVMVNNVSKINFTPPSTFTYDIYYGTFLNTGLNFVDILFFDALGQPIDLNNETANLEIRVYP